ncbi:MAG: HAD family phosphatase [Silicimonas sp.]|nr:HAD family phosphatase [Silicimonas sp.]
MDGLLLDTERVALRAFQDVVAPFGMGAPEAEGLFLTLIGSSGGQTRARLAELFPDHADTVDSRWNACFADHLESGVPLRPGAFETVTRLARKGVAMAVVTSTGRDRARHHLDRVGLLPAFVDVIGGDSVTSNKPHPEPYLKGALAVARDPANCVAFEDSDTGTRAAVAAGCRVWQIPDLRPPGLALPDLGQAVATTLVEAVEAAGL